MQNLRRVSFYLFAVAYLILCPLIILDALGIKIQLGRINLIIPTGLISLTTTPPGADIEINHRHRKQKTPIVLRGLNEGVYHIKLTLSGYHPWEKDIPVVNKQATSMNDILLFPNPWPIEELALRPFDTLIPMEGTPFFLVRKGNQARYLMAYIMPEGPWAQLNRSSEEPSSYHLKPLLSGDSPYIDAKIGQIWTVPKSTNIVIQLLTAAGKNYLWIDLKSTTPSAIDLTPFFDFDPDRVIWSQHDPTTLFAITDKTLTLINAKDLYAHHNILHNVRAATVHDKKLLVLDWEHQLKTINYDDGTISSLTGELPQTPTTFHNESTYTIHVLNDQLILFLSPQGQLLCNRLPYKLIDRGVEGFAPLLHRRQLLVWTKSKIGIINFAVNHREGIFDVGPSINWVVTDAKNVIKAVWVNNGSHILFLDNDQIYLQELDTLGQSYLVPLAKTRDLISYSDESGILYYIDKETNHLTALTVVPGRKFLGFESLEDQPTKN